MQSDRKLVKEIKFKALYLAHERSIITRESVTRLIPAPGDLLDTAWQELIRWSWLSPLEEDATRFIITERGEHWLQKQFAKSDKSTRVYHWLQELAVMKANTRH